MSGVVLLWDAAVFVTIFLLLATGTMFEHREAFFYPLVFGCVMPLTIGYLVSVYHLVKALASGQHPQKSWHVLIWAGPFGPGLYLSALRDQP